MPSSLHLVTSQFLREALYKTWASEDAMASTWASTPLGPAMPFDRTKHGDTLVRSLFRTAWREAYVQQFPGATAQQAPRPTGFDMLMVAAHLVVSAEGDTPGCDYNILSQVLPNLVPATFILDKDQLYADLKRTEAEFDAMEIPHPLKGKKAKVDPSWDPGLQARFTRAQALAKTASTFEKFTPPSWRVSPYGKTPALTDSANLSGLSALADPYVRMLPLGTGDPEPLRTAYVTWDRGAVAPTSVNENQPEAITILDLPDKVSTFISESGGSMLGQVMLARGLAYDAWLYWASILETGLDEPLPCFYVMTKLNSLRLVGPQGFMESLKQDYMAGAGDLKIPGLTWSWDSRIEQQLPKSDEPIAEQA